MSNTKQEDAIKYLSMVKRELSSTPQAYAEFQQILKDFKAKSPNFPHLVARVRTLFQGQNRSLLLGLQQFLPDGCNIEDEPSDASDDGGHRVEVPSRGQQSDSQSPHPPRPPQGANLKVEPSSTSGGIKEEKSSGKAGMGQRERKLEDALQYLDMVKCEFSSTPASYDDFIQIMSDFKRKTHDASATIARVRTLFHGRSRRLLDGFFQFLPEGSYKIEDESSDTASLPSTKSSDPTEEAKLNAAVASSTGDCEYKGHRSKGGLGGGGETGSSGVAGVLKGLWGGASVEFDTAIKYMSAVERRFANDRKKYLSFLQLVSDYQKDSRGHKDLLDEVSTLFADHPDLIQNFTVFLPDGVQEEARITLEQKMQQNDESVCDQPRGRKQKAAKAVSERPQRSRSERRAALEKKKAEIDSLSSAQTTLDDSGESSDGQPFAATLEMDFETRLNSTDAEWQKLSMAERRRRANRDHVVFRILVLSCPRCGQACLDFEGSFSMVCSRDGVEYCAYCLADCGTTGDVHRHVRCCEHNTAPGKASVGGIEAFENSQRERRVRMMRTHLAQMSAKEREDLLEDCAGDLRDTGIDPLAL